MSSFSYSVLETMNWPGVVKVPDKSPITAQLQNLVVKDNKVTGIFTYGTESYYLNALLSS